MEKTLLSGNYDLEGYPDAELIETIDGRNLIGDPVTAYVYRTVDLSEKEGFTSDGADALGLGDLEEGEPVPYDVQIVKFGEEPSGEMPLSFGEKGLEALRRTLGR